MLELKHLRTIRALSEFESLTKAANALATSQSALSHQIKELELRLAQKIYIRHRQPISFTLHGEKLLALANEILPKIDQLNTELAKVPQSLSLSLGFACHACFQWLIPICQRLNNEYPNIHFDYHDDVFEESVDLDVLLVDEHTNSSRYIEIALGSFEQVAVVNRNNPLVSKGEILAKDFEEQILLTYPIEHNRLDLFKHILSPMNVTPKKIKSVNNSHTMLQMINSNLGVAVLPNWLVSAYTPFTELTTLNLNPTIKKTLYIRLKQEVASLECVKKLVVESRVKFANLLESTIQSP
ncbi:LysR family transcriptional regulator [Thalassotalea sp. M1531]|uniref:LysR family transcriptional regulator n=1 Tax=Thalassotalea algicola TaxID=2716224 RepID=A0A7Y0Q918_9GAMM|nr:LysR substrate-binding domain-containing protein [Thalassotalea algicola]NMP33527.1 LysR family transcriptional regulator [Thalassotalea algicola]